MGTGMERTIPASKEAGYSIFAASAYQDKSIVCRDLL